MYLARGGAVNRVNGGFAGKNSDARKEPLQFDIFRRGPRGYTTTRKQDGGVKSVVFGKSFRLEVHPDEAGHPEYTLRMR